MFLFLTAAHGRAQVLLFTFVCENESRKKQKALVVARPHSGPGFESPQYPASLPLWLQAPLSCSPKDLAVPRRKVGSCQVCQGLCPAGRAGGHCEPRGSHTSFSSDVETNQGHGGSHGGLELNWAEICNTLLPRKPQHTPSFLMSSR